MFAFLFKNTVKENVNKFYNLKMLRKINPLTSDYNCLSWNKLRVLFLVEKLFIKR